MQRRGKRILPGRGQASAGGVHRRDDPDSGSPPALHEAQAHGPTDDLQARREEIARLEERALHEQESLRLKAAELERREQSLEDRERNLEQQTDELKRQKRVQRKELERLSGLSESQAKQMLIADVEHDARHRAGASLLAIEEET
jgi:hypothetical protein